MAEEVKEVKENAPLARTLLVVNTAPWALAGFLPRIPMVRLASVVPA
jgi:hypothetical protein